MAKTEKTDNAIVETIKTVVYALLIAGVFRTLFFQPFWIPSGSMKETLLIGDFVFVNKMAYGYSYASCPSVIMPSVGINVDAKKLCGVFDGDNTRLFGSEPERGDVVVFRHPISGRDYIKRLIGLPGDQIQIINGIVQINGVAAPQEPAGQFEELMELQGPQALRPRCANGAVGQGELVEVQSDGILAPAGKAAVVVVFPDPIDEIGDVLTRQAGPRRLPAIRPEPTTGPANHALRGGIGPP